MIVSRGPKTRFDWIALGLRLGSLVLLLCIWELAARRNWYRWELAPPPSALARYAVSAVHTRDFWIDIASSLRRVALGFVLAVLAGMIIALLFYRSRLLRSVLEGWLELIRPIPPVAWVPISILWFGIGEMPAHFIVLLGSFFPILVSTSAGLRAIDPVHIRIARSFGANAGQVFRGVVLPSILPYLFSGFRTGLGVGWMSVITAEMIGAQSGLGYRIQLSRYTLQTENILIGMIIIGLLGVGLMRLLLVLERKFIPWRPGDTTREAPAPARAAS